MKVRTKTLLATVLPVALVAACAMAPKETYKDMKEAMEVDVEPLVETTLPTELNKDADKIDFVAIRSAAMRARLIFRMAVNKERHVYINDPKVRKHAPAAAKWFTSIADAAMHKKKDTLVSLFKQKQSICANCHKQW